MAPRPCSSAPLDNSLFWGMVAAGRCYFDQVAALRTKVAIVGISGLRPGGGGVEGVVGMAFWSPGVMFL